MPRVPASPSTAPPTAPLWVMKATRPGKARGSMLAERELAVFMMPAQLGPISRTPASRAAASRRRSPSRLPTSAKPEVITTATGAPAAPASRTAPSANCAGRASTARSRPPSIWLAPEKAGRCAKPSGGSALGLTTARRPAYPARTIWVTIWWAILPCLAEPNTATVRG